MRRRIRRRGTRLDRGLRGTLEDPLTGAANMVDLMLVFACGLLVALVLAWDLVEAVNPETTARARMLEALREAEEVESVERTDRSTEEFEEGVEGRYENLGRVYRDTASGRYFMLEEPR